MRRRLNYYLLSVRTIQVALPILSVLVLGVLLPVWATSCVQPLLFSEPHCLTSAPRAGVTLTVVSGVLLGLWLWFSIVALEIIATPLRVRKSLAEKTAGRYTTYIGMVSTFGYFGKKADLPYRADAIIKKFEDPNGQTDARLTFQAFKAIYEDASTSDTAKTEMIRRTNLLPNLEALDVHRPERVFLIHSGASEAEANFIKGLAAEHYQINSVKLKEVTNIRSATVIDDVSKAVLSFLDGNSSWEKVLVGVTNGTVSMSIGAIMACGQQQLRLSVL